MVYTCTFLNTGWTGLLLFGKEGPGHSSKAEKQRRNLTVRPRPCHGEFVVAAATLYVLNFDCRFWQGLGHHMSKLYPGQSVVHLKESNVAGNRQGENVKSY